MRIAQYNNAVLANFIKLIKGKSHILYKTKLLHGESGEQTTAMISIRYVGLLELNAVKLTQTTTTPQHKKINPC
jgi:hypothetical protein